MIDQYGTDALIEAAMRFDAMLKNGDLEGVAVWKQVMRAIDELQAEHGSVRH